MWALTTVNFFSYLSLLDSISILGSNCTLLTDSSLMSLASLALLVWLSYYCFDSSYICLNTLFWVIADSSSSSRFRSLLVGFIAYPESLIFTVGRCLSWRYWFYLPNSELFVLLTPLFPLPGRFGFLPDSLGLTEPSMSRTLLMTWLISGKPNLLDSSSSSGTSIILPWTLILSWIARSSDSESSP